MSFRNMAGRNRSEFLLEKLFAKVPLTSTEQNEVLLVALDQYLPTEDFRVNFCIGVKYNTFHGGKTGAVLSPAMLDGTRNDLAGGQVRIVLSACTPAKVGVMRRSGESHDDYVLRQRSEAHRSLWLVHQALFREFAELADQHAVEFALALNYPDGTDERDLDGFTVIRPENFHRYMS